MKHTVKDPRLGADRTIRQLERTTRATGWLVAVLVLLVGCALASLVASCNAW